MLLSLLLLFPGIMIVNPEPASIKEQREAFRFGGSGWKDDWDDGRVEGFRLEI